MKKVLISAPCSPWNMERIRSECDGIYEIRFLPEISQEEKENAFLECEIIIGEPDYSQIKDSKILEWVQMTWAGTDKYTRVGPFPTGVKLTNASGAFGIIISEYVLAGILSFYRRFSYYQKMQEKQIWDPLYQEDSLYGKNVLILGAGNIGIETAKRFKAFECHTFGIRRKTISTPHFDEIGTVDQLEDWLSLADVVVCAMPNNRQTMGLLTYEKLRKMKETSIIINVGRGHIFEEGALEKIMDENRIAGAILDVQRVEPLAKDHIFWTHPNVRITPHISGPSFSTTKDTENRIYQIVIENLKRYSRGEQLLNMAEF